jgi:two-component sensor histidine kinase
MSDPKKIQVIFTPGCFDDFEGTQEELDEFIAEIQRMADSGELLANSEPVDLAELAQALVEDHVPSHERTLH